MVTFAWRFSLLQGWIHVYFGFNTISIFLCVLSDSVEAFLTVSIWKSTRQMAKSRSRATWDVIKRYWCFHVTHTLSYFLRYVVRTNALNKAQKNCFVDKIFLVISSGVSHYLLTKIINENNDGTWVGQGFVLLVTHYNIFWTKWI